MTKEYKLDYIADLVCFSLSRLGREGKWFNIM